MSFMIFWLVSAFPVSAGTVEDAVEAYNAENYMSALPAFQKLADTGNNEAQFYLGMMYDQGHGVDVDYLRAAVLYKEAADNGHTSAKAYLAELYETGKGVPKDMIWAMYLYRQAAEQGNEYAIEQLERYPDWKPDAVNIKERKERLQAARDARVAAEETNRIARQQRYQAEQIAIAADARAAQKALEVAVAALEPIENGWAAYNAGDYQSAYRILLAHANLENAQAQTRIGVMYRDGKGVAQSDQQAGEWFERAEKGDSGEAYYHHAMLAFWGRYNGACCLMPEGLMKRSYRLGYQPAIDRFNQKEAEAKAKAEEDREIQLEHERRQAAAVAVMADNERRRAEHERKYGDGIQCTTSIDLNNVGRPYEVTVCE